LRRAKALFCHWVLPPLSSQPGGRAGDFGQHIVS